jgi:Ser/Thr protein kinase RdoA (MazF antagonist)
MSDLADHPLAERFHRLTPERVLEAVETGGRRATGRFLILNSYENRVYQFEMEDGSWVVGKFYRPGRWSRETILAEHHFLAELDAEEIPVAVPLEIVPGSTLGEVEDILFALYPRLGGRAPDELDDEQVALLGRLLARIHNVGARRDAPERIRLGPTTYGRDNLARLLELDVLPIDVRSAYAGTVEVLLQRIEPLFLDVPVHRIHGDCHLGNLLWTPRGAAFLDFDDMAVGPAVQDVWLLVGSADDEGRRQREKLVEAYAGFRDFSPIWLRLVEPLRALRYVHYATWIARRWGDPIFRRTFAHFGSVRYWQDQVQDLREQIARIDREAELS